MKTRLTDVLEVEHPVMLAGMGGVSYSKLVAAVSEAGGLGRLGASAVEPAATGRQGGRPAPQARRRRPRGRRVRLPRRVDDAARRDGPRDGGREVDDVEALRR